MNSNIADTIITILVAIFLIAGFIGCIAIGGEHLNGHINDKYKDKEDDNKKYITKRTHKRY